MYIRIKNHMKNIRFKSRTKNNIQVYNYFKILQVHIKNSVTIYYAVTII